MDINDKSVVATCANMNDKSVVASPPPTHEKLTTDSPIFHERLTKKKKFK